MRHRLYVSARHKPILVGAVGYSGAEAEVMAAMKAQFVAHGNKGKAFHTHLSPAAPVACQQKLGVRTCFDCPLIDCETDTNKELSFGKWKRKLDKIQ